MAFLDDKAEVIVAVDIEGIGEGCVGQLGIRRQILACDALYSSMARAGSEKSRQKVESLWLRRGISPMRGSAVCSSCVAVSVFCFFCVVSLFFSFVSVM